MEGVLTAWGRILTGHRPVLSVEITRECPLRCPGCYAYGDDHLGGVVTLREVSDLKGHALVDGVMALVDRHRPLHVSIVGGEPLVRHRELATILPMLAARGIYTQVVTSAVREIPRDWAAIGRLSISVSIDGLQKEHDERRSPATYARILKHIAGHQVIVHCTITGQQSIRPGYIKEFLDFWSAQPAVRKIWISLYTPQIGEVSAERLAPRDRERVLSDLTALAPHYAKLELPDFMLEAYANPPQSPAECVFAQITTCVSADLRTPIAPCQFGGAPDCASCGCAASAGLTGIARHQILGFVPVGGLLTGSLKIGERVRQLRPAAALVSAVT